MGLKRLLNFEPLGQGGSLIFSQWPYNKQTGGAVMYLHSTIKGEEGRRFCETTLKMDPAEWDIDAVNRVEVFGTHIDDAGEDYCEFRVYDCTNKLVAVRREMGY